LISYLSFELELILRLHDIEFNTYQHNSTIINRRSNLDQLWVRSQGSDHFLYCGGAPGGDEDATITNLSNDGDDVTSHVAPVEVNPAKNSPERGQ
jgi:hypothetical protein